MEIVSVEDIVPLFELLEVEIAEEVFDPNIVWLLLEPQVPAVRNVGDKLG